jgi:general secretion pathway protein J
MTPAAAARGFTLIELLTALLILSLLAVMAQRGLGTVLDARAHIRQETAKWQRVAAFSTRFEQDVHLVAPYAMRLATGSAPALLGRPVATDAPRLEFSRFAAAEGVEAPRRVGYGLNERQEVELWLWEGLDADAAQPPARYPVLADVAELDLQYLGTGPAWVGAWPAAPADDALPRAVRLRLVLASGEEIVRVFALNP